MTTTTIAKQRKVTDRARKREEAARRKRLAVAAKAMAEEAKADQAAPAIQRTAILGADGMILRGVRLEFDGKTHTVHRANPIRTLAERSRNKDHALFRKEHADACDRLIASFDIYVGGVSSGVGSYEQRSSSMPETGSISDATLRSVNSQIQARREIEVLKTHFGASWNILHAICILGVPISTWAATVPMKEEPASGYVAALLDRLINLYSPEKDVRSRIRTIEFS